MPAISFTYVFRGRGAAWWVGTIFTLVGVGLIFVLPFLLPSTEDGVMAIWILRLLGSVFLVIGVVVLALMILKFPGYIVHTIGGLLGALSFGIPSTFALPGLWLAHRYRPNMFFGANDPFGNESLLIGIVFSVLGIITTIATIALARYQFKNQKLGWSWSWNSDDGK